MQSKKGHDPPPPRQRLTSTQETKPSPSLPRRVRTLTYNLASGASGSNFKPVPLEGEGPTFSEMIIKDRK